MPSEFYRYAVYFAPPPDSPLGRFGNGWLGRDPAGGPAPARPNVAGLGEGEIAGAIASPARYGFHATLKPPFRLAEGADPSSFLDAVAALAREAQAVAVPGLEVREIGDFVALVPQSPLPALDALAAACVRELDGFRAPALPAESARRRQAGLTSRQDRYLGQWGYPYVFEEFRFHLTLTGRLAPESRGRFVGALARTASDAASAFVIEDLAVFGEAAAGAPFELLRRFRFGGVATDRA